MNAYLQKRGYFYYVLVIGLLVSITSPLSAAKTKLTLAFAGTFEMNEGIVQAARAFEQANPDIAVELLPTSSGRSYYDRLTVMAIGGTAPDVALVAYQFLPPFIDMGVLTDLKPFFNRPGGLRERDFVPIVLDSLSFGGKLYAIPRDFTSVSMYINTDMLDKTGVPIPDPLVPLTVDEYLQLGRRVTRDLDGDGVSDQFLAAGFGWSAAVQIFGGQLWDHYRTPTKSTANDPKVMEALDWVRDLRLQHQVLPPFGQSATFQKGQAATYFSGRYEVPNLRSTAEFSWDIRPFPTARVRRPEHGGSGWMAFDTGSDPDALWKFLSWLGGPEGQSIEMASGRIVPALMSLLRSTRFLNDTPPHNQQVWLEDMQRAARPLFLQWQSSMDAITPMVNRFMQGGQSSQWLVTEIERSLNSLLK